MTSGAELGLLSKDHHIPLRRQLAAGLEAAIRDGHISPGAALPSTRDLARHLGIHRSTVAAAYARLRRRGCVSGGVGRRVEVATLASVGPQADSISPVEIAGVETGSAEIAGIPSSQIGSVEVLSLEWVRSALRVAFEHGLEREAMLRAMSEILTLPRGPMQEIFLVEPWPGLRRILAAELHEHLGISVRSGPRVRGGIRAAAGGPLVARREVLSRLLEPPRVRGGKRICGRSLELPQRGDPQKPWESCGSLPLDMIPLDLAGGTRERGIVRRRVRSGLVVLISVSAQVRRYASELAAREFSRGVSFVALDPGEEAAVLRAVAAARLILSDAASSPRWGSRIPTCRVRLLEPRSLDIMRGYLGAPSAEVTGRSGSLDRVRSDRRCGSGYVGDVTGTVRRGT